MHILGIICNENESTVNKLFRCFLIDKKIVRDSLSLNVFVESQFYEHIYVTKYIFK